MFENFKSEKIAISDVEINSIRGGEGPPVLLLHGYPQNLALWAKVAPMLAKKFTVVCADLRGYGDSSKPQCLPDRSNYSFRAMAADQAGLMAALGYDRFHVIGHDRGGRTAHRMALDWPEKVLSLSVLDIVPTYKVFMDVDRHLAGTYWHWYFLALPEPFPEHLIGADPDYFYETCLVGWGGAQIADFDRDMLAEYRRCWRDPAMIHGSCSDYRAAATIDLKHDEADLAKKVACPSLVMWGVSGAMAKFFDIEQTWRERCDDLVSVSVAGGHFFIDQAPEPTAAALVQFLTEVEANAR